MCGRIAEIDPSGTPQWFVLDDGSVHLIPVPERDPPYIPVPVTARVLLHDGIMPRQQGSIVAITGISACSEEEASGTERSRRGGRRTSRHSCCTGSGDPAWVVGRRIGVRRPSGLIRYHRHPSTDLRMPGWLSSRQVPSLNAQSEPIDYPPTSPPAAASSAGSFRPGVRLPARSRGFWLLSSCRFRVR